MCNKEQLYGLVDAEAEILAEYWLPPFELTEYLFSAGLS
jgi:hypothetical protein